MLLEAPPPPPPPQRDNTQAPINPRALLTQPPSHPAEEQRDTNTNMNSIHNNNACRMSSSHRTAFQDITNSATKDASKRSTRTRSSNASSNEGVVLGAMSPNYAEMMRVHKMMHNQGSSPIPAVPVRTTQQRLTSTEWKEGSGGSSVSSTNATIKSGATTSSPIYRDEPPPPRAQAPQPYASPTKGAMLPPPPPLIAILERQQQAAAAASAAHSGGGGGHLPTRTVNPRQQFMANNNATSNNSEQHSASSHQHPYGRDVPPPPPLRSALSTASLGAVSMTKPSLLATAAAAVVGDAASQGAKVLTKYHFLKNFTVKPKTPNSKGERPQGHPDNIPGGAPAAGGGAGHRRRRGDMSPLPVAPQIHPDEALDEAARSCRPQMAATTTQEARLPCTHDNSHRTIPTMGHQRAKAMASTSGSPSPIRGNPKPSGRMGALAALPQGLSFEGSIVDPMHTQHATPLTPPSPNKAHHQGGGRRRNHVQGPSAAAGVTIFLEQHQHQAAKLPMASVVFPTPIKQRDVARSLMDDLEEMMSPQGRRLPTAAPPAVTCGAAEWDNDEEDQDEDVGSPLLAIQQPAHEAVLATPIGIVTTGRRPAQRSNTGDTGCGRRAAGPPTSTTSDGGYPADNDMSSPSMVLPSPTTLGSLSPNDEGNIDDDGEGEGGSDSAAHMLLLSGGDYPPSVASTAQGEFELGEFEDDEVSPMTEDDNYEGRRVTAHDDGADDDGMHSHGAAVFAARPLVPTQDSPTCDWVLPPPSSAATAAFANFFSASGFSAPSAISVQAQRWEQEHSRYRQLLLQNYTKNLLLGMLEHSSFVDCAVTSFVHHQERALVDLCQRKRDAFFNAGYTMCVAIPAVVSLEWHGRLLEKMRRDLFMRAMVRQFLKATPRTSKSSPGRQRDVRVRCSRGIESLNGRHSRYTTAATSSGSATTTPAVSPTSTSSSSSSAKRRGQSREDDDSDAAHEGAKFSYATKPPTSRRRGEPSARAANSRRNRTVSPSSSATSAATRSGDEDDEGGIVFSAL